MEELEREYLISYYEKRLGFLGETPAALGWTEKGQQARFEAALKLFTFAFASGGHGFGGFSLLDYGCGMGDFYGFLLKKALGGILYSGFDINPALINVAKKRYAELPAGATPPFFGVLDIDNGELPGLYDYALICGVFNQKVEGASEAATRCMAKVWSRTEKALVFNALSGRCLDKDASLEYYDPAELMEFAALNAPGARVRLHENLVEGDIILHLSRH